MSSFTTLATKLYDDGLSCSEAIVSAALECELYKSNNPEDIKRSAAMFGGGMSSGCACGAITGSQIILGLVFGSNNRKIAAEFIAIFKQKHRATCCVILSKPYKGNIVEHKKNCRALVEECATILEYLIKKYQI